MTIFREGQTNVARLNPDTLHELAAALAPLIAMEAVKVEVARITPEAGDLVAFRPASPLSAELSRELSAWWHRMFPDVAMVALEPGSELVAMRPEGASLRALAEALRPVLRELDREMGEGA